MEDLIAGSAKLKGEDQSWIVINPSYWHMMISQLEKSEFRVLGYLISKTKVLKKNKLLEPNFIKVKKNKMAEILDLSPSGVIKALNELESKGFIEKSEDDKGTYRISTPSSDEEDDDDGILFEFQ